MGGECRLGGHIPPEWLKERLEENGLYFDTEFNSLLAASLSSTHAFLLRGPPGVGKTSLVESLAKIFNVPLIIHQCTIDTSTDDFVYKLLPSEHTISGIEKILGPLPEALILSREGPVILLIDEFDKTRPSADAFLLDFLQNARLSVRLSSSETIIQGVKSNLFVFLTSNDERELSEPLLRRLAVLYIPPLPTRKVFEILCSQYGEKIALLLAQIYDDTLKAGLRKPATLQELRQLGEILREENIAVSFSTLVRSLVVKYDDDWQRYVAYIEKRTPYTWLEERTTQRQSLSQYYESETTIPSAAADKEEPPPLREDLPKKMPTIMLRGEVRKHVLDETPPSSLGEVVEEGGVLPATEEIYDAVIKVFEPEPPERPEFLKVVEVYKDYAKLLRTLTYDDIVDIVANEKVYDFDTITRNSQILFRFRLSPLDLRALIRFARRTSMTIVYYTTHLVRMKKDDTIDLAIISPFTAPTVEVVFKEAYASDIITTIDELIRAQKSYIEFETLLSKLSSELETLPLSTTDENTKRVLELIRNFLGSAQLNFTSPLRNTVKTLLKKDDWRSFFVPRKEKIGTFTIEITSNAVRLEILPHEVK